MATQIPPLLESYLALPPETSQLVLTGVLGASTNWLVLRYLYSLLRPGAGAGTHDNNNNKVPAPHGGDGGGAAATGRGQPTVLLVSFMRDYAFWKDGAGRLGLNLDALAGAGRFSFVDGLSRLFLPGPAAAAAAAATSAPPARGQTYLDDPRLAAVARALGAAVDDHHRRRRLGGGDGEVVLVLDQPDVLLAAAGPGDGVTGASLRDMVLDLREKVHATVLAVSADEPLVAAQTTALEKEHAALVLSLAHEAEAVLSLRLLDTGAAKDVSGVVRITRGGAAPLGRAVEEHEYLYRVGGDGGVKVFERGQ